MAFYNPQRVVFNPDKMVIQSAGKVGGVLYDIMSKNYDDKVKAHQFKQQMDLKQQEMDLNEAVKNNQILQQERNFDYQAKQDEFKNDLALKQFDFLKQKESENNALAWAKYNLDKDYKNKYLDYLANKNTSNSDIANFNLNIPKFLEQDKNLQIISQRLKDIQATGAKSYYDSQGLFDGTWENIKGLSGGFNANKEQTNMLKLMSDYIYIQKVRRDTNYNRQRHDEIYKEPSAWLPQTINAANASLIVKDFLALAEAGLNELYNEELAKISNLKNPLINQYYENMRQEQLKKFREKYVYPFTRMYLNGNNNTSLTQGQRLPLKDLVQTAEQPMPTAEELQKFIKFK